MITLYYLFYTLFNIKLLHKPIKNLRNTTLKKLLLAPAGRGHLLTVQLLLPVRSSSVAQAPPLYHSAMKWSSVSQLGYTAQPEYPGCAYQILLHLIVFQWVPIGKFQIIQADLIPLGNGLGKSLFQGLIIPVFHLLQFSAKILLFDLTG